MFVYLECSIQYYIAKNSLYTSTTLLWLTVYVFEQTRIVKVYDSILMAIFYVNSKSDPNSKVLDDYNDSNQHSIYSGWYAQG